MLGYTKQGNLTVTACTDLYIEKLCNLVHYWEMKDRQHGIDMVMYIYGSFPGFEPLGELESKITLAELKQAIYDDPRCHS